MNTGRERYQYGTLRSTASKRERKTMQCQLSSRLSMPNAELSEDHRTAHPGGNLISVVTRRALLATGKHPTFDLRPLNDVSGHFVVVASSTR